MEMKIRLGDIQITDEQKKIVSEILDSGNITEGKYVKLFEKEVAKFLGAKHVIAVTNGTVSMQLISHYLQYKHKRKMMVCVPATTFPATLNAFYNCGFDVMLCDVGKDLNIDLNCLSEEQKKLIDVLVPVSLLGYPPKMTQIMEEAEKYDWYVVEDFAEAFGSSYNGKKLGTIGDFGSSSFYVSHVIQAGELGIVVTNDDEAAAIMRSMKNHGRVGSNLEFTHDYIGSNYKVTEFVVGLCYPQILKADSIIAERQSNVLKVFNGIENPRLSPYPFSRECSYLGYPILADTPEYKKEICSYLNSHGIETRGMFPCLANQKAYDGIIMETGSCYPTSDYLEKYGFYIGVHQYLRDDEIETIIKGLNEAL